ncbi:MAG: TIGR02996 domain-containing protein [Myxococcota bacterium]|nr:TIGR02996 domain-containing protein [Deltaproteobacteria bacterium]MDQ3337868.1 TIGR02996 domain-containing protein [Myxococcota bacterium]
MIDFVRQLFPVEGTGFRIELAQPLRKFNGTIIATVRISTFDDDGSLRDMKEQELDLVPAHHQNQRGMTFLEHSIARAQLLTADQAQYVLPSDLFRSELMDAPVPQDAFSRVLDDPRALAILERRRDDARLLATIDPATRTIRALRNAELEAAILERIEDPGAYSVYGDWLAERGDPRGELIALQLAGKDATALIEEYAWEWLGGLAWLEGDVRIEWRFGFPKAIRIGSEDGRSEYADVASLVRSIARVPGMMFVDTIEIGPTHGWHTDVFQAIGEVGLPAATRNLSIQTPEHEHMYGIDEAYPKLQSLVELRLESRSFELGTIALPNLHALDLVTRGLTKENLESLREASWPKLERFVVWISDEGVDECDVELDDLDWILAGDNLPAVKHLGLCGRADTQPLLDLLLEAPITARLDVLDLPYSDLKEEALAPFRAKFPKLSIVDDRRFIPCYE